MGSVTVTAAFTGDERALERWFADRVADDEREYGHRQGYSGRWNSCGPLSIMRRKTFGSIKDADAWFDENLERRSDVIAVLVDEPNETFEKAYPCEGSHASRESLRDAQRRRDVSASLALTNQGGQVEDSRMREMRQRDRRRPYPRADLPGLQPRSVLRIGNGPAPT